MLMLIDRECSPRRDFACAAAGSQCSVDASSSPMGRDEGASGPWSVPGRRLGWNAVRGAAPWMLGTRTCPVLAPLEGGRACYPLCGVIETKQVGRKKKRWVGERE